MRHSENQPSIFHAGIKLTLGLLFACLLSACGNEEKGGNVLPAAPVRVAPVAQGSVSRVLNAVGTTKASATVSIAPRVGGEIMEVNFTEGQNVQAGQPLLVIDPRPYQAELAEKRGQLAKSQAQLAKAENDRVRFGKLVGNGYVSQEAFEQSATDAAALRATVQADRAAVENAALNLSYCTLKAPISGRIGALNIHKGNIVKSGDAAPIAQIDTISPCYVAFSVPEANLPAIQEQMKNGQINISATPTGGSPAEGVLTFVDNNVDTRTGTIPLRATFDNKDQQLWPGQYVEVKLPLGVIENALIVPSSALQTGRDENFVYIVEDGKAVYHRVQPIFESDGKTVVSGDLSPSQQVIIEGQMRLAPGRPVNILN